MKFPKNATISEVYGPAMQITDAVEAREYFEACVVYCMNQGKSRQEAEEIERHNLGYYAGYYSNEIRVRVEKLFGCQHPIFEKAAEPVTCEEAFKQGMALADKENANGS